MVVRSLATVLSALAAWVSEGAGLSLLLLVAFRCVWKEADAQMAPVAGGPHQANSQLAIRVMEQRIGPGCNHVLFVRRSG